MKSQYLKKHRLPDNPGIYIFRDSKRRPLYIGRATSLKDRVKSYFSNDLIDTRGPRLVDMITKALFLTWENSSSVLEAIILESALIKKYRPFYNIDEMDDRSAQYVIITDEEWPRVFLARARDFEQLSRDRTLPYKVREQFGPFLQSGTIKEALKILRKMFPFRDKKAYDVRHEAFYRAIGQSPNHYNDPDHQGYLKTVEYLTLFFHGRKKKLREEIVKEMEGFAGKMQFEAAGQAKRLLYALEHINDVALIKHERKFSHRSYRIEAYDVAHLSGMETVGVMVVSCNGELMPSEYRRFKISKDKNDDLAGLGEILSRRLNHSEWPFPDIIAVDGNDMHIRRAESVLKARRIAIPVIAVTKDDKHKAANLIGHHELIKQYKKEIVALNSEAHRFAISYHRRRRRMKL